MEKQIAAYHEAGHAVAGKYFGFHIFRATIIPDEYADGRCANDSLFWIDTSFPGEKRTIIKSEIVSIYAGHEAEFIFSGKENLQGAGSDFHKARRYGKYLLTRYPGADLRKFLQKHRRLAKKLVIKNWSQVQTIAEELLKKETLTSIEIDDLLGKPNSFRKWLPEQTRPDGWIVFQYNKLARHIIEIH